MPQTYRMGMTRRRRIASRASAGRGVSPLRHLAFKFFHACWIPGQFLLEPVEKGRELGIRFEGARAQPVFSVGTVPRIFNQSNRNTERGTKRSPASESDGGKVLRTLGTARFPIAEGLALGLQRHGAIDGKKPDGRIVGLTQLSHRMF